MVNTDLNKIDLNRDFYSIIIPVFNSTNSLFKLADGIEDVFAKINSLYELIFIDDGSSNPETQLTLRQIHKRSAKIKIIFLRKNFGQHAAILCGMSQAKGNYIITMDDDLQHSPDLIIDLIKEKHHDVVYAKFKNVKAGIIKIMMSRFRNYFNQKSFRKSDISISSFTLYKKEIVDVILSQSKSYPMFGSLIFSITDDIVNVEFQHKKRFEGKSGYTIGKLFNLFVNIIFNHSSILVRIIFYSSLFFFFISFLLFILILAGVLSMPGLIGNKLYPALFFLSSVILFGLGVIGEFLRRILSNLQNKALFVIKEILENRNAS